MVGRVAELPQLRRRADLVEAAFRGFLREPGEEARQRRAVAQVGCLAAGDFGRVLDGFRDDARVARLDDGRAVQRLEHRRDGGCGVDDDGADQRSERRWEGGAAGDADGRPQMRADLGRQLGGIDEQVGGRVGVEQRKGERDRGVVDVLAADIQYPGDRIERGDNRRRGPALAQTHGDTFALGGTGLARELVGMHLEPRRRRQRTVGPHCVDRVCRQRDQACALRRERRAGCADPVAGVQPGVEADPVAGVRVRHEPVGGRCCRDRNIIEQAAVDLRADLQGIASVGEHRGLRPEHRRRPGRTAEPRQPRQPLGIAADIFAHMFVGQRHDEAGNAVAGKLVTQSGEAGGMGRHERCPMVSLSF